MIDTQAIRNKILDLAMRGQLTEQLPEDGTAEELFQKIQAEKQALIKAGKIKKDKLLPEIISDDVPFEIPGNWKWIRFAEICSIINGDRGKNYPAKSTLKHEGIPFISALNLNGIGVTKDENLLCLDEHQYALLGNGKLQKDDIVICIRGSLGKHGRYPFEQGAIASSLVISRLFYPNIVLGDFEMAWLDSPVFPTEIQKYNNGTAQPNLAANNLEKFLFPLPPFAEQQRIVDKIDQAFSILDTIDVLQSQYADNLTALKTKLIDAAIQGKLTEQLQEDGTAEELYQRIQDEKQALMKAGKIKKEKPLPEVTADEIPFEIPENWKWVTLGNITTKITSGSTPTGGRKSNVYVKRGFPLFREQNIYDDGIHQAGMVFITEELLNTRQNSTVFAKDILLNITGGSIGRCALVPDNFDRGSINQHILIIRTVDPEIRFYIHMFICSPYVQSFIKNKAVGDKDGFSGGRCKKILVPLPPLKEQKRIAQRIDELMPLFEK